MFYSTCFNGSTCFFHCFNYYTISISDKYIFKLSCFFCKKSSVVYGYKYWNISFGGNVKIYLTISGRKMNYTATSCNVYKLFCYNKVNRSFLCQITKFWYQRKYRMNIMSAIKIFTVNSCFDFELINPELFH